MYHPPTDAFAQLAPGAAAGMGAIAMSYERNEEDAEEGAFDD